MIYLSTPPSPTDFTYLPIYLCVLSCSALAAAAALVNVVLCCNPVHIATISIGNATGGMVWCGVLPVWYPQLLGDDICIR